MDEKRVEEDSVPTVHFQIHFRNIWVDAMDAVVKFVHPTLQKF